MSTNKQNQTEILKELGIGTTSEFDGLSANELTAEEKRLDVQLKKLELSERLEKSEEKRRKIQENKTRFEAAMRRIQMDLARIYARQRGCSHRKGGLAGREGLPVEGGNDDNYALLKHQLPSGDWLVTCQRCAAEWLPEDRFSGRPATVIGGFTYRDALMARTDNSPSKSAIFRLEDHRSPEQVEAEKWQPPRNEQGELIKDERALVPNSDGPLQPPAPSLRRG